MTWPAPDADVATERRRLAFWRRPTWMRAPDVEAEAIYRLLRLCFFALCFVVAVAGGFKSLFL